MSEVAESWRLDDPRALTAADPGDMLRQVASSAAQIRQARLAAEEAGLARLAEDGRPRAIVVTGMGGSGISGEVLAAVCGVGCPVPVLTVRGYRLPGWVGAADLVIAVSCSGTTEETLAVAAEAVRRGCRMLLVGGAGSPLADLAAQARAPFVPVHSAGMPRSTLWGLSIPLVLAARALGLANAPDEVLEATARRLEDLAHRCRPSSESFVNPAKRIALDLAGELPMVWGSSDLAATAAYRMCCQLNENAKYPGVYGGLPETDHNQVVTFDGFFAGAAPVDADDFFRDRVDDPEGTRLRLVVLRDTDEHPQVRKRREVSVELAQARGVAVTEITAEGEHPLERIASLIAMSDYVTVYLAIALGVDPTPVSAIQELKARIA
ncbi:glucose/mannose-6-phosphate isomerase [Thermomonospora echinospora]|uniref:Glucose/mannose-6-phosphate isomerase n=1 Tax=Thermomonospora echinospora TaxID=1992 RepID=A0A1H5WCL2_9ACTN|nr:bifunctional phosphoglucose/phosphomannose isomerase [Thermomonospora echinospora]SEF97006.1 glucose/mannose-6-phosphate isomerase [Thermomonospora echinospora]